MQFKLASERFFPSGGTDPHDMLRQFMKQPTGRETPNPENGWDQQPDPAGQIERVAGAISSVDLKKLQGLLELLRTMNRPPNPDSFKKLVVDIDGKPVTGNERGEEPNPPPTNSQ